MPAENKKYEILKNDKKTATNGAMLYRIRALKDIGDIAKKGEEGGYIQSEGNLSHEDYAWVYGNAEVYGHDAAMPA